jgi:glycosyltransferase involved in cell wall biosynthesis
MCPTLIQAFERLLQGFPDAHLLIAGDGPMRANVERAIADRMVGERVRLLGWREDLTRVYATIDVCVSSSRNEGTPVSLIEAMAAGRAVIATRVGGVSDIVANGETGILVPPGDVEALAGAMATLANDVALRSRLGRLARERTAARFGYERLVDDIDQLYKSALGEKRHQPA